METQCIISEFNELKPTREVLSSNYSESDVLGKVFVLRISERKPEQNHKFAV